MRQRCICWPSTVQQLTDAPGGAYAGRIEHPRISGGGGKIVFVSSRDPLGTNPSFIRQLYIANADGSNLLQLTSAPLEEEFVDVSISDDGKRIVFSRDGDLLPGQNTDESTEV